MGPWCGFRLCDDGSALGLLWRVLGPMWRMDGDVRLGGRLIYGYPMVQRLGTVRREPFTLYPRVGDAVQELPQLFLHFGGVLSCASR